MAKRSLGIITETSPAWNTQIESIIGLSSSLISATDPTNQSSTVSSDLGIIALLYFVVSRCQKTRLVEEALKPLKCMWRRESVHSAATETKVTEMTLQEEKRDSVEVEGQLLGKEICPGVKVSDKKRTGDIGDTISLDLTSRS